MGSFSQRKGLKIFGREQSCGHFSRSLHLPALHREVRNFSAEYFTYPHSYRLETLIFELVMKRAVRKCILFSPPFTVEHRKTLTRPRRGCTCLAADVGRSESVPKENRTCQLCPEGIVDIGHLFLFLYQNQTEDRGRINVVLKGVHDVRFKYGCFKDKQKIVFNSAVQDDQLAEHISKAIFDLCQERIKCEESRK